MELTLQKTSWPNLLFNPSLILNQGGIGLILFNQLGQNKHVPNYHWKKKWRWNWKEIKAPMKTAMEQVHCIPHLLLEHVWERGCGRVLKKFEFFFLLKFNMVCTFWIVLMCWYQKWFLKNEKTSLACILARKVIWKAPATTLPNTL
jgi:hypothetical protein